MRAGSEKRFNSPYSIEDFDYPLPESLIAQRPLERRDECRLLVARRSEETLEELRFGDIAGLISPGDVLVLNDTKVFPARILGRKMTGGKVEILLLAPSNKDPRRWRVLLQPALKEDQEIRFESGGRAYFRGRDTDGTALVEFEDPDVRSFAAKWGTMPLPPYIRREAETADAANYQTVYASREGAVAAPTAGLHFTPELLLAVGAKGAEIVTLTLHVGYGTFRPVQDIETHRMHAERFMLGADAAARINRARDEGRKVWAVGTTAVRALETCVLKGRVIPGDGETDLFIFPPSEFEAANTLITNFHLPRSTLLMLVGAFMGVDFMKRAYRYAVEKKFRFYSYGDAMLIL